VTAFWIVAGVVSLALAYLAWTYNRLVSLNRRADGAWSDVDVQLKRRWDLVPALVETVKGYARHESNVLEDVVKARTEATRAANVPERGATELGLSGAVGRLFAVAESYPDLKAGDNFRELHRALVDVEDHVQYARRYYNAVVRDLNTLIEGFPSSLAASAAGFAPRPFFQIDEGERSAPRVTFDAPPPSPASPEAGEARP